MGKLEAHIGFSLKTRINFRPNRDLCFQVSSLIAELASAAAAEKYLVFEEAMEDRLCAYSRAVSQFPTAVKEVKHPILKLTFYFSLNKKIFI